MEEKVFHLPAVAGELESYVEARLHTDGPPRQEENIELELKLTGLRANPVFVIVNPWSERKIAQLAGATTEGRFAEFLRSNIEAARAAEPATTR